jgi:DNA-binding GntR family transcriptional regulator
MRGLVRGRRSGLLAYNEIRARILSGGFGSGERLTEERLARELGISRTPVRQALARLEAEGLVAIVPNRGAVVRSYSPADVLEIYDLRALLEGHAAREAATNVQPTVLEALWALVNEMEGFALEAFPSREEAVAWFTERNNRLHQAIHAASGNRRLVDLLKRTIQIPLVYRAFFAYTGKEFGLSQHYHVKIVQALERRDGDAAEALMRAHIYQGRDVVLSVLGWESRGKMGAEGTVQN